jgi:hypothetical protein
MNIIVPPGLNPGDKYYLAFVTAGTRDALSTDITDYDKFVQSEAERPSAVTAGWGISWRVVGSTPSTIAINHLAFTTAPIYRLDATLVKEQAQAVWTDGRLQNGINITQFARFAGTDLAYTGSSENGDYAFPGGKVATFGAPSITMLGDPASNDSSWIYKTFNQDRAIPHPFYAVSSLLTAP